MKIIIAAFLAVLVLGSCSASWHVRKARKLDPTLFEQTITTTTDTVTIEVPTVREKIQIDTLIEIVQLDPITNIETVIRYKIEKDSIFIDCPDNEVITVVETRTEVITLEPTFWQRVQWFAYSLGAVLVFVGIRKVL